MAMATVTVNRALGTWRRSVDTFIAPSEFVAGRLAFAGIPVERTVVKPNYVADPGARRIAAADSGDVLFLGRLEPEKGVAELLEAWARAAPRGLRLVICGEGSLRKSLERGAPESVSFKGWVDRSEVIELLLGARASVLPSLWYEGLPLVALESFAAGAPVLASNLGASGELAASLGPEWLAPPGDVAGWGAALERLADGALIGDGSRRAREQFELRFSERPSLEALERIYRSDGVFGRRPALP